MLPASVVDCLLLLNNPLVVGTLIFDGLVITDDFCSIALFIYTFRWFCVRSSMSAGSSVASQVRVSIHSNKNTKAISGGNIRIHTNISQQGSHQDMKIYFIIQTSWTRPFHWAIITQIHVQSWTSYSQIQCYRMRAILQHQFMPGSSLNTMAKPESWTRPFHCIIS